VSNVDHTTLLLIVIGFGGDEVVSTRITDAVVHFDNDVSFGQCSIAIASDFGLRSKLLGLWREQATNRNMMGISSDFIVKTKVQK
jgi:hypothetical protein